MFVKSRKILAIGTAVTVATAGVAIAGSTGAQLNDAKVISKVKPSKLSKKKFTPVNSLLGVVNSPNSTGNPIEDANGRADRVLEEHQGEAEQGAGLHGRAPEREHDRSSRRTPARASRFWAAVTVDTADRRLPQVDRAVRRRTPGRLRVQRPRPRPAQAPHLRPDLGPASPMVDARIVKATQAEKNKGYGQGAERAERAGDRRAQDHVVQRDDREGRPRSRRRGVRPRTLKVRRTVTYTDDTSETASKSQKCKVKR